MKTLISIFAGDPRTCLHRSSLRGGRRRKDRRRLREGWWHMGCCDQRVRREKAVTHRCYRNTTEKGRRLQSAPPTQGDQPARLWGSRSRSSSKSISARPDSMSPASLSHVLARPAKCSLTSGGAEACEICMHASAWRRHSLGLPGIAPVLCVAGGRLKSLSATSWPVDPITGEGIQPAIGLAFLAASSFR